MRKGREAGLGSIIAFVLFVLVAGQASAASWSGRQVGESALFGMSCPTATLCVAAGTGNVIVSSTNPAGGAGSWNLARAGEGAFDPGVYSPARQIRGVDCPSPGLCVAASLEGLIYSSTNPTGGASAWTLHDLNPSGPNTHMYGVSCPTPNFCAVAASKGKILTSTNPVAGPAAWTVTQLPETLELRAISCPTPGLCVAVGLEGQILSSTNPLGGPAAWRQVQLPGAPIDRNLLGVSCPSAGLCVTGNSVNTLFTSTDPTGPAGKWIGAQGGSTVQITALDCPSPSQCIAIDNNADVLTSTDPTGGSASWTFTNLLPFPFPDEDDGVEANGMFGVSCPSASLCAIAGAKGQIFTSSDPFTPPPPTPSKKKHKRKKKRHGPRHPRAFIGAQPPAAIEISGRKAKVRFRFFALNHASVRGFVCTVDQRPMKRCRSPKVYRIGVGIHVFRVRAVSWAGPRGPVAYAQFKVCHPTPRGFCLGAFSH